MEFSIQFFASPETQAQLVDAGLIQKIEDVIAFGVAERKKKQESSSRESGKEEWSVSDNVMALIASIIWTALRNRCPPSQAVYTPRLVSLLIGVGEGCGGWAGWNAMQSLSEIIKGSSAEQFTEMVEMGLSQRILDFATHSDQKIREESSDYITHILNRVIEARSGSSMNGEVLGDRMKRKEMVEKVVGDVLGWMKKDESRKGREVVVQSLVRFGNVGGVETMMQWGLGEILSEMVGKVGMTAKGESGTDREVFPRLWERGMKENEGREKRKWRELIVSLIEEEGEEDGTMDGIGGMMNNPMITRGFSGFDQDVFGDGDIRWKHSLKKLCAFLG